MKLEGVPLSPTELRILRALSRGYNGPAIARMRGSSPHTEACHIKNIRAKLQAETVAHAVAIAMAEGII